MMDSQALWTEIIRGPYQEADGVSPADLAAALVALAAAGDVPSLLDEGACVQYGYDSAAHATFSDPERQLEVQTAATLGAMVSDAGRMIGLATVGLTDERKRGRARAVALLILDQVS